jgi:hypothetical protein
MVRTIAVTALVAAVLGFGVGWLATKARPVPTVTRSAMKPPPEAAPAGPVAVAHRFAPRQDDVAADRETPAVAVAPGGAVVVAWASQTGDLERTLYLARSTDGGATFGTPSPWRKVPIYRFASRGEGRAMTFSTHVLPRLAAGRDGLHLGWVEAADGGPTVRYYVARSVDGGATFSEPVPAHGEDASRPGFTALWADPEGEGGVACGWIDGRNKAPQPFFAARPGGSEGFGPESLVFAGPDGRGICPCCDVAVTRLNGDTFVAFRNNDSGHRDVWVARDGGGGFGPPSPVTRDPWTFNGCPHDGPSLATVGDRLVVAWMDAHTGRNRVYVAGSPAAALAFEPRELGPSSRGAQGHPRLAAGRDGVLHAVWDEGLGPAAPAPDPKAAGHGHGHGPDLSGGGRAIMYASSRDGGEHFGPAVPLDPRPGAYQVQPSLSAGPDGAVIAAWNEIDQDGKRVVVARLAGPPGRP